MKIFKGTSLLLKKSTIGQPRWLIGLAPPTAQGKILETWDRVPRQAPCMEPASRFALCLCLSLSFLSLMNKINKIFLKIHLNQTEAFLE